MVNAGDLVTFFALGKQDKNPAQLPVTAPPFQLLVQFNEDLLEILPKDHTIPSYRIQTVKPDEPLDVPAEMFLITKFSNLNEFIKRDIEYTY